jgi:hypothetical protein
VQQDLHYLLRIFGVPAFLDQIGSAKKQGQLRDDLEMEKHPVRTDQAEQIG